MFAKMCAAKCSCVFKPVSIDAGFFVNKTVDRNLERDLW